MSNPDGESGPQLDNAASEDAFAKAFGAAADKVNFDEYDFAEEAVPAKAKETTKPVETEKTEDAAPAKPEGKVAKTVAKEAEPDIKPVAAKPADEIKAPAHWNKHWSDAFSSLPPEGRKFALDLAKSFEADYTRKSTELAEDRKFAQSVKSLITPAHRVQMERAGLRDDQGLAHLVGLNDFFTKDPPGYLRFVTERSGMDPRQVWPELFTGDGTAPQGQQPQPTQADPYSQQYFAYLKALEDGMQSLRGDVEGFKRERQTITERTADQSIERFRNEKDAEGNPAHPHLAQVEQAMVELLTTPKYLAIEDYGERLKAAYDRAVRLDDTLYKQTLESEAQKRLKEARAQEDVAKARKAKAPVKSSPVTTFRTKPDNLGDIVSQAMNDVLG